MVDGGSMVCATLRKEMREKKCGLTHADGSHPECPGRPKREDKLPRRHCLPSQTSLLQTSSTSTSCARVAQRYGQSWLANPERSLHVNVLVESSRRASQAIPVPPQLNDVLYLKKVGYQISEHLSETVRCLYSLFVIEVRSRLGLGT